MLPKHHQGPDLQQLLPDLYADTNHGALPHTGSKEAEVSNVLGLSGDADSLADLLHLGQDDRAVKVTAGVQVGKVEVCLLPAVVLGEPSRRLREEEEATEQNEAGDGLDAPGNAEGRGAVNVDGAAIRD